MMKIVFATNNPHKLLEIREILADHYAVVGLQESGINEEIPEDHFTLNENALQKAQYIKDRYHFDCFADDTGLEIDALNGEPGVFSARYSRMGELQYPQMDVAAGNIRKVLEMLAGKKDRSARFRTVIALILNDEVCYFEGIVEGAILTEPRGIDGFGYDPIFQPAGYDQSFAEMELDEKNRISHRARAVQKLFDHLINIH